MNAHMQELVKRFDPNLIKDDGRGNSYVPHSYIVQRLIHIYGEPPQIEILRELYDGEKLTGVIMRLTVPGLEPVEEAGEADNPQSKTNGARAKDACSDAIKRCAMRLGLGLHLWAQENYYLDTLENTQDVQATPPPTDPQASAVEPEQGVRSEPVSEPHAAGQASTGASSAASSPSQESLPSSETEGELVRLIREFVGEDKKRLRAVMGYAARSCINHPNSMPTNGLAGLPDVVTLPRPVLEDVVGEIEKVNA